MRLNLLGSHIVHAKVSGIPSRNHGTERSPMISHKGQSAISHLVLPTKAMEAALSVVRDSSNDFVDRSVSAAMILRISNSKAVQLLFERIPISHVRDCHAIRTVMQPGLLTLR